MNETTDGVMVADSTTIELLNSSEINQQVATAHRYPRSIKRFRDECTEMVTLTEAVAAECIYALPRGGKSIEGPSARFAEVIASAWGNCRAGARVIDVGNEFVTAQGAFHDLERNVAITYEVKRRITDSNGFRYKPDMIAVTANAACSIALRNSVLKGIPKVFWSDMYLKARATAGGDEKSLNDNRNAALTYIKSTYEVQPSQVCKVLGVDGVEDIGLPELTTLRGLLTAINEGDTTAEQAFSVEANDGGTDGTKSAASVTEKLREPKSRKKAGQDKAGQEKPAQTASQEAGEGAGSQTELANKQAGAGDEVVSPETTDQDTQTQQQTDQAPVSYAEVREMIDKAETLEDVTLASDLIRDLPKQFHVELYELAARKQSAVEK